MSITPLRITGVSAFSDDFQTVLNRAVSIAQIPVTALQNQQGDLLVRKQLTSNLRDQIGTLADAAAKLGELGTSRALVASSSNVNRVAITNSGATLAGTFSITKITSIARAASENSVAGLADANAAPVDPDGVVELVIGGETHELTLTDNSLNGLRDAINALGVGVNASVLNTGTGSTPYYLSLTAAETGATTLELRGTAGDSGSNLLTSANQGADAVFELNGLPVRNSENLISGLIDGVTLSIVSTTSGDETVTISLAPSKSSVATALTDFVAAYNAAQEALSGQVGENAGLLSGDYLIRHSLDQLRSITGYSAIGSSLRLTDLGIEVDKAGKMSFNSSTFYSLTSGGLDEVFTFLGSQTAGFGAIAESMKTITDPVTGLIANEQTRYDEADRRLSGRIAEMVSRISYMQSSLAERLQQADAILASLESQQKVITASVQGLELTLYGRNNG